MLPDDVGWRDVLPVAVLGAIGDVDAQERAAAAVRVASVLAPLIALVLLRRRSRA